MKVSETQVNKLKNTKGKNGSKTVLQENYQDFYVIRKTKPYKGPQYEREHLRAYEKGCCLNKFWQKI